MLNLSAITPTLEGSTPTEPDHARLWNAAVRADRGQRWRPEVDQAFWSERARHYDAGQVAVPNTLQSVAGRLRPDMTLLDVGAGTGRFALPLAGHVQSVTALDHSQAMLDVLRGKLAPGRRIETVCAPLDHPELRPHDAVLVAWALYRCTDLNACLNRLLALAAQELLIVDDDGQGSPHRQFRRAGQGSALPRASTVAGALRQLGAEVEVQTVQEEGRLHFTDQRHCLTQLGQAQAGREEERRFLDHLEPYLHWQDGQLVYRWPFTVSLLAVKTFSG